MNLTGRGRARRGGDGGETLVEILVALAILGIGITALLVALATNAATTTINRDQAQAEAALVSLAEYVKSQSFTDLCAMTSARSVGTAVVKHDDSQFKLEYGPAREFESTTPCAASTTLVTVPVKVTGGGFADCADADDATCLRIYVVRRR